MPSLPSVFVELRANASQFTAAMQSAQNELKKTADVAQSSSDRMAQVGKVAFAGISAAAVGFGAVAVKAALDGQQAHAQLVQAVQNSGTAFSSVGGAVDAMSERFANFGYQNDAVEEALTRLVQGTGNTKTGMENMGLAADLARGHHMDLTEAAGSLAKVLSGNMKGMMAFGLSAKDAGGNTLTVAQAVAELNSRFGGAAAAQAGTYAGQLEALHAKFQNLQEKVGNQLLPVLARMGDVVAGTVGFIERNGTAFTVLAGIVGGPLLAAITLYAVRQAQAFAASVAQAVGNVVTAVWALVPAAEAAEVAESGLATTTALATGGLSLLTAGAALLVTHMMSHSSATKDADTAAASMAGTVDGLAGAEGNLEDSTTGATGALKAQEDLFKQLSGDTYAQTDEILKLIGDTENLDRATKTLSGTTRGNSEAQKAARTAADALGTAQDKLNKATKAYNDLQAGVGLAVASDQNHAHHDLEQAQLSHEEAQTKLTEAVAQYGQNSVQARQADLDLESSTFTLMDAQAAMGRVGEEAWKKVDDAQQNMIDAQKEVTAKAAEQQAALEKLNKPAGDLAANTLAWQQAQNTLNKDWEAFDRVLAAHPELRDQLVKQIAAMKAGLPKGSDIAPLDAILKHIDQTAATLAQVAPPGSLLAKMLEGKPLFGDVPAAAGPPLTGPAVTAGGATVPVVTPPMISFNPFGGVRAAGGPVLPGGTYLVGEQGPELLRMGSSAGTVIPGAGGVTVVVNVAGSVTSERDLVAAVRDGLMLMARNSGSLWGQFG